MHNKQLTVVGQDGAERREQTLFALLMGRTSLSLSRSAFLRSHKLGISSLLPIDLWFGFFVFVSPFSLFPSYFSSSGIFVEEVCSW